MGGGGQSPGDSSVSICLSSPSASAHSRSVTIIFAAERGSVVLCWPQIVEHGGQSI